MLKNHKYIISKLEFRMTFLLLVLLEPQFFQNYSMIHNLYKYLGYLSFIYIAMLWVNRQFKKGKFGIKKKSGSLYVFILFACWMLLVCFKNNTPISLYLSNFVPILGVALWIDYYAAHSVESTLRCLTFVVDIYIIINFATILIWPEGLYSHITEKGSSYYCWFLGYKNPQIRFFLPAIAFNLCYDFVRYGKIQMRSVLILIIVFITESRLDSSTSLVGLFVFCVLYILWGRKEKLRRFFEVLKLSCFYIVNIVISILIVVFNIQEKFSYIITETLHRDLTFTNRTIVWSNVLLRIAQRPVWGYGLQTGDVAEYYISATHAHNYMLNLIYTGGFVAFAIITVLWLISSQRCKEFFHLKSCKVLMFICASFLIMGITEALTEAPLMYPLLILISKLEFFKEKSNVKKGGKISVSNSEIYHSFN